MMKIRLQSGCIPYRVHHKTQQLQVLIVKKKSKSAWWGFTKGGLEPHLTPEENAAKECYEEAGVTGRIKEQIGTFEYDKDGVRNLVYMYAMDFFTSFDTYPEKNERKRKWVSMDEAFEKISKEHHSLLEAVQNIHSTTR